MPLARVGSNEWLGLVLGCGAAAAASSDFVLTQQRRKLFVHGGGPAEVKSLTQL